MNAAYKILLLQHIFTAVLLDQVMMRAELYLPLTVFGSPFDIGLYVVILNAAFLLVMYAVVNLFIYRYKAIASNNNKPQKLGVRQLIAFAGFFCLMMFVPTVICTRNVISENAREKRRMLKVTTRRHLFEQLYIN